jgi:hypothetical protein
VRVFLLGRHEGWREQKRVADVPEFNEENPHRRARQFEKQKRRWLLPLHADDRERCGLKRRPPRDVF